MKIDINHTLTVNELVDEQIQKEGIKPKPVKPIEAPVLAKGHTAVYRMHRYWARRPHNVFANLIRHYTNPGDIVLDPFMGGGVTVVESLKARRKVVGVDYNPLAVWITENEIVSTDIHELESSFDKWYDWMEDQIQPLYLTKCSECSKDTPVEWYEWSNVYICPFCQENVILGKARKINKPFQSLYECTNPSCKAQLKPSKLEKSDDVMINLKVKCRYCEFEEIRPPEPYDIAKANQIANEEAKIIEKEKLYIPDDAFPNMDRARDDNIFGKGLTHFRDFFTPRQRISLGITRKWIEKNSHPEYSINSVFITLFDNILRFTNKMVIRSEAWRGTKPFEWAGHMFWNPFTYLEATPLFPFKRRANAITKGKEEISNEINNYCQFPKTHYKWDEINNGSTVWLLNQSSDNIPIPDNSIDSIITDPPYGGNVQYLELSDFFLVWLKGITPFGGLSKKDKEAIETRHQGFEGAKDSDHYENMLYQIFRECRRVIKENGWMVMTFHNRDIRVWTCLHRAAQRAGFRMPTFEESPNRGLMYQPEIKNYSQTIHQRLTGSLLGDFILSFKPTDVPSEIEALRHQLSLEEEKTLQEKSEEIIRYLGGASEDELWTRLIPYLSETGILARVANFNLKQLLGSNPFTYIKPRKKWFMEDMLDEGHKSALEVIPAEEFTQAIVYSYLKEKKYATIDDLLVVIYGRLVNAQMPGLKNISNVLSKYCSKEKVKGKSREVYRWNPHKKLPQDEQRIKSMQTALDLEAPIITDHNSIITAISKNAISLNYDVHAGKTEQRKSPILANLSISLTGFELGLGEESFSYIREIDLLILKNNNIQAAIEVVTTLSTLSKALNDRFRNLLIIAPNLNIPLYIVVKDSDCESTFNEIRKPANLEIGLHDKIEIVKISQLSDPDLARIFLSKPENR